MKPLYMKQGWSAPCSLLREADDFGIRVGDFVHPPRRFWSGEDASPPLVELNQDLALLKPVPTPATLLAEASEGEGFQIQTKRSLARLWAHFLICEDPQRRMDAHAVDTLSHQVTLVEHVLGSDNLRRVLIADEVGLGKTVEAGLIVKRLLEQRPQHRVLYLAPARLVRNVWREFERLDLGFRVWSAAGADARLSDPRVIASMHRAVRREHFDTIARGTPWDVLIVDEAHHLSAWSPGGTDAKRAYSLVEAVIGRMAPDGRVILLTGTPHQGHGNRFENLLRLLRAPNEHEARIRGRVIYRTKDDIRDWDGNPLFPRRRVNPPIALDLAASHRAWIEHIHEFYTAPLSGGQNNESRRRAVGWRCAQAMQWAASSPNAGLGYLVRQAIRSGWRLTNPTLARAIESLRPYRLGSPNESVASLFARLEREVGPDRDENSAEDVEDSDDGLPGDWFEARGLESLLREGIAVVNEHGDFKWETLFSRLLAPAGTEKVVLFAQPIETVTALAGYLERRTGRRPAMILGGQDDETRDREVAAFRSPDGPQFLVSSRAGGEGINLQVARRLVHVDVPWNPMDMEQRVGRVHRFGSRDTIIVDTVVVRDSRETHMYDVARQKLRTVASALVDPERFEAVFSRVMSLVSPEELQTILINEPEAPLSSTDQLHLANLVQEGFRTWSEFHRQYGQQLQTRTPGKLRWEDVVAFLTEHGGAKVRDGFRRLQYRQDGHEVTGHYSDATVIELSDGTAYVAGDYGENLVYSADGSPTPKLGLNRTLVTKALRELALHTAPSGAVFALWPEGQPPVPVPDKQDVGILVFLRQSIRIEQQSYSEHRIELLTYLVDERDFRQLDGPQHSNILRTLVRSRPRRTRRGSDILLRMLQAAEERIYENLRIPNQSDRAENIRHSVTPFLAAVVGVE